MAQNIYDEPGFFAGYSQLARSARGLSGAPEWPSVQALLPEMRGLRVLDLGCGFGWFCRWAREQGAASVLGLDLSERMLARARALTDDAAVAYERADLEHVELPEAAFDVAFSSLTLHYVEDLGALLARLHPALVPGGHFVATMEHPIYTDSHAPGWFVDAEGRRRWPLDSYQLEGKRVTD
jgi:SAM-dependent methyltransferase